MSLFSSPVRYRALAERVVRLEETFRRRRAVGYRRHCQSHLALEPLEARSLLSVSPFDSFADESAPELPDAPLNVGAPVDTIEPLTAMPIVQTTGEKPQSKVWRHDNQWFSALSNIDGSFVFRLDGTAWTPVLQIASGDGFKADVKEAGDVTHIMLVDGSRTQLVSVEYVPGAPGTYQLWSQRPNPTVVGLNDLNETATIDIDSTGRMWVAYDNFNNIEVRYSDGPYTTWSDPIVLASNVNDDDICTVTALPNGTIGVLWSNRDTQLFDFRSHVDGTDPTIWAADELPGSIGAFANLADDHVHTAVGRDGTLFAAVKTTYSGSLPQIGLLVRHPNGVWDPLHPVSTSGTRPIVVLDEAVGRVLVIYTAGGIVYRESPVDAISFGSAKTLIAGSPYDDATSTKQNITDELVVLASASNMAYGVRIVTGSPQNTGPTADAGVDQSLLMLAGTPLVATLDGTVADDGIPNPPGHLTTTWTKISGPAPVAFTDPSAVDTTITFSSSGTYVFRLHVDDGQYNANDYVTITVKENRVFQDGLFPNASYDGTIDTRIRAGKPNENHGTDGKLTVSGSSDSAGLIRWDLSSLTPSSHVDSASVTLMITTPDASTYELYEVKRNWAEMEATWNRATTANTWQIAGAQGVIDRGTTVLGTITASALGYATIELNAAGVAVVQQWVDNPASNHGLIIADYTATTAGFAFRSQNTSSQNERPKLSLLMSASSPTPVNSPPLVNAGLDQSITLPAGALLDGTASDDGLLGPLSTLWSKVSGPGNVSFVNPLSVDTTATFTAPGTYVLQLAANDGELVTADTVTITVVPAPINSAPIVSAGADQSIMVGQLANLDGTITDDGLPSPPGAVSATWSALSGPGSVTFGTASAVDTTASFSLPGVYVLRLTGNDGVLATSDDVMVVVNAPTNQAPVVNAGADQSVFLSSGVSLTASVTDDGLPNPPSVVTLAWSVVSGPGSVSFANASAAVTSATFTMSGNYILRLSADDGVLSAIDDIAVNVMPDPTLVSQSFQDGVDGYSGTTDTKFRVKDPTINYGLSNKLELDGVKDFASVIKWDLSSVSSDATVVSANLTFDVLDGTTATYELYEAKRPWAEMTATWNQYAAGANWQLAGAQGSLDRGNVVLGTLTGTALGLVTFDLNAAGVAVVQSWIENPSSNHGFVIQDYASTLADPMSLRSREESTPTKRPKLTINYLPAPPAPAMAGESMGEDLLLDVAMGLLTDAPQASSTTAGSPSPSAAPTGTPSTAQAPAGTSSSSGASFADTGVSSGTAASGVDAVFASDSVDDLLDPLSGLTL